MTKDLPQILRKLRQDHDLSQDEIAKKIGISLSKYSRLERSEGDVDLDLLIKITDVYKITVDQLLHFGDPNFKIEDPKSAYKRRWNVPVTVTLDGTAETLQSWFAKLTAINASI